MSSFWWPSLFCKQTKRATIACKFHRKNVAIMEWYVWVWTYIQTNVANICCGRFAYHAQFISRSVPSSLPFVDTQIWGLTSQSSIHPSVRSGLVRPNPYGFANGFVGLFRVKIGLISLGKAGGNVVAGKIGYNYNRLLRKIGWMDGWMIIIIHFQ